jgi:hypothetical protein
LLPSYKIEGVYAEEILSRALRVPVQEAMSSQMTHGIRAEGKRLRYMQSGFYVQTGKLPFSYGALYLSGPFQASLKVL